MVTQLPSDIDALDETLDGARQALRLSNPNPRVGCVIVGPEGQRLGTGSTQRAGSAHAEVMALRDAEVRGSSVRGATVYVSLEPCSHHGRTPPCCDALIAAGVGRVVVFSRDPNPKVAGQGIERLRAAGIAVDVLAADSPHAREARELNIGFFSRMVRGTPWVRLKVAASLDGVTALDNGVSQWITADAARIDGHAWRARACAVLTGVGTVLSDDPTLNVRLVETHRQPHLIVVDSRLQTPPTARLFQAQTPSQPRQIVMYHAVRDRAREAALSAAGAQLVHLPDDQGKVSLPRMLKDLAEREVNELHVEAGRKLNGSLLREGLVDELLLYLAPQLLGSGAGLANLKPLERLEDGLRLRFASVEPVGEDLRILARVEGQDAFLRALP